MNEKYCSRETQHLFNLFSNVAEFGAKYISDHYKAETKVIQFLEPKKLKENFDFTLPRDPSFNLNDETFKEINNVIEKILQYSVRTGSPRYFNQLWSGTDVANIIAEWISAFTNSSTYTYEVAPVYSLMEIEIVNECLKLIDWKKRRWNISTRRSNCKYYGNVMC